MKIISIYLISLIFITMGTSKALSAEISDEKKRLYLSELHDKIVFQDRAYGEITASDGVTFEYYVFYVAQGSFGKVFEIEIDVGKESFSTIAKVMVNIEPIGGVPNYADDAVQKLIMNYQLLSGSRFFIKYLGLIGNKAATSTQNHGVTGLHPTILLEKGGPDLFDLFLSTYKQTQVGAADPRLIGSDEKYYSLRNVLNDMVDGLAYMHSKNLAHLDLKPENMLMGLDNIVKIIDTDDAVEVSSPTVKDPGPSVTILYAAPERYWSLLSYTNRTWYLGSLTLPSVDWKKSDVYSLGMSMLAMVSGLSVDVLQYYRLDCFKSGVITADTKVQKDQLKSDKRCALEEGIERKVERMQFIAKGKVSEFLAKNPPPSTTAIKPLYDLIMKMIKANPKKRLSIEQVQEEMRKLYPRG